MRGRRQRQRAALLCAVALVASGLGIAVASTDVLRSAELATVDARFDLRGVQAPPGDVVLVGLDDTSLEALDLRPPIPRRLHARVLDELRRAGAKVIAIDFEFLGATTPADDDALLTALRRARGVVLAASRIDADGRTDALGGAENRTYARAVAATVNFPPRTARGGIIRRLVLGELGVPAFAVEVARRAGARVDPTDFDGDGAWIDFPGPAGTVPVVPFADVLRGRVDRARLNGKVVVVGPVSSILKDVNATAAGTGVPGPEVNVAAIDTVLRGLPLRSSPGGMTALWLAAAALATPLAALRLKGLRWLPVPLVVGVAGAGAAQLAFGGGRILPVLAGAVALLTSGLGTLAVAYATDVRDRRRLHAAFALYVPPAVVDEVVAQAGDDLRLGGVRRDGTVMFCDLRGFTSVAERLEPEAVITLLNLYLSQMTAAILDHGGTVVSFMGDGIMAVFGAPLQQGDHADRALAAAREMLGPRLDAFNAEAALAEPMRMGMGICSGPVLSGNVGSQRRVEYAAVGDTTNTAARLEQLTKDAGVPLLVADATRAALTAPAPDLQRVGEVQVRGRQARLLVWTLPPAA